MKKNRWVNEAISELVSNRKVSDETVYIVHQFLSDLVLEFEAQAYCRLRRYSKAQEEKGWEAAKSLMPIPF